VFGDPRIRRNVSEVEVQVTTTEAQNVIPEFNNGGPKLALQVVRTQAWRQQEDGYTVELKCFPKNPAHNH